jgi:flagellar basal body-associated protein FliL
MDFKGADEIIDKARTQPGRVLLIVIVIILFTILIAYTTTFTSKKAEKHAKPTPPSTQTQPQKNIKVEQRTEGDQSPAIKTDEGDVTLNYGGTK